MDNPSHTDELYKHDVKEEKHDDEEFHSSLSSSFTHDIKPKSFTKKRKKDGSKLFVACVVCRRAHAACDSGRPCKRCIKLNREDQCRDPPPKKRGRPRTARKNADSSIKNENNSSMSIDENQNDIHSTAGSFTMPNKPLLNLNNNNINIQNINHINQLNQSGNTPYNSPLPFGMGMPLPSNYSSTSSSSASSGSSAYSTHTPHTNSNYPALHTYSHPQHSQHPFYPSSLSTAASAYQDYLPPPSQSHPFYRSTQSSSSSSSTYDHPSYSHYTNSNNYPSPSGPSSPPFSSSASSSSSSLPTSASQSPLQLHQLLRELKRMTEGNRDLQTQVFQLQQENKKYMETIQQLSVSSSTSSSSSSSSPSIGSGPPDPLKIASSPTGGESSEPSSPDLSGQIALRNLNTALSSDLVVDLKKPFALFHRGLFLNSNPQFCILFGCSLKELQGRSWKTVIHQACHEKVGALIRSKMNAGLPCTMLDTLFNSKQGVPFRAVARVQWLRTVGVRGSTIFLQLTEVMGVESSSFMTMLSPNLAVAYDASIDLSTKMIRLVKSLSTTAEDKSMFDWLQEDDSSVGSDDFEGSSETPSTAPSTTSSGLTSPTHTNSPPSHRSVPEQSDIGNRPPNGPVALSNQPNLASSSSRPSFPPNYYANFLNQPIPYSTSSFHSRPSSLQTSSLSSPPAGLFSHNSSSGSGPSSSSSSSSTPHSQFLDSLSGQQQNSQHSSSHHGDDSCGSSSSLPFQSDLDVFLAGKEDWDMNNYGSSVNFNTNS